MAPALSRDGSAEASTSRAAVNSLAAPVQPAQGDAVDGRYGHKASLDADADAATAADSGADAGRFGLIAGSAASSSYGATAPVGSRGRRRRDELGASASASAPNERVRRVVHIPASMHSMVAGAGAGLVSSIATCPLDVVKTTLQAQSTKRGTKEYEGVRKTCFRIYRQSGIRGFYRGLGPTIAGYLPTWGIYFTVYDWVKERLGQVIEGRSRPEAYASAVHVTAAMTAGATGTILTNPLWVVKTRFMAVLPPDAPRYRSTLDAIVTIYRKEGFMAFYRGLLPSLFGITHVAVQFGLYEKSKEWATNPLSMSAILVCSSFSKMVASLATYPHEVIRTRMQIARRNKPQLSGGTAAPVVAPATPQVAPSAASALRRAPQAAVHAVTSAHAAAAAAIAAAQGHGGTPHLYSPLATGSNPPFAEAHEAAAHHKSSGWHPEKGGIVDTFRKIQRQDGWRGFYRGLSINLVRTVPSSAVTMLTYELIMRNLS